MNFDLNGARGVPGVACVIRARGGLDENWSARLRGLKITVERDEHDVPVTVLRGELPDSAALNGVLTTLYSLGLSLASVESTPVSHSEPDSEL